MSACDRWQDLATSEIQPLTSHGLDHYDVVNWILRPVSEANSGSFVEMVATCTQELDIGRACVLGTGVGTKPCLVICSAMQEAKQGLDKWRA